MHILFLLPVLLLAGGTVFAQHVDTTGAPTDAATNLYQAFKKGKTSGHFRYFYMATDNRDDLSDYYAHALGGGLRYATAPLHHLQLHVSGFFVYNIGSSDLSREDAQTHQYSRYEQSLFDLQDPHNTADMDRLEELHLRYKTGKAELTFGKQVIHSPFINPQDSRMRPTDVEGLYGALQVNKRLTLDGGWVYRISPRATVKWFSVANSIGVNSQGINSDGTPGDYAGNLQSKGVALLGSTYQLSSQAQVRLHNLYIDNISNTVLLQADYQKNAGSLTVKAALQYIRQDAVNKGGNADRRKTYFDPDQTVNILGVRTSLVKRGWETSLNYTRITRSGRFTMPREWGVEPLFTYMARERNEGLGDVHAVMASLKGSVSKIPLKTEIAYGYYYLPDVSNASLNKYGLPSYRHGKLRLDYTFGKAFRGADLAVLYVYKGQLGNRDYAAKYSLNKVGMHAYNLILNYSF